MYNNEVMKTVVISAGGRNHTPPIDEMETKRALARRQRDEERAKKLHYGHLRRIGADIAGLNEQMNEKKKQNEKEREEEENYQLEHERIESYINQMETELNEKKIKENLRLQEEYRKMMESKAIERKLQNQEEMKIPDEEQFTASSLQRFQGEDINYKQRQYLQKYQMKEWVNQKEKEKEYEKVQQEHQKYKEKEENEKITEFLGEIEKNEKIRNYLKLKEIQDENKRQMEKKLEEKHLQKQKEREIEANEIEYQKKSRLLCDQMPNDLVAERIAKIKVATGGDDSNNNENNIISEQFRVENIKGYKDLWKGLSKEEIKAIDEKNYSIYLKEKERKRMEENMNRIKEYNESENLQYQLEKLEYNEKKKEIQRLLDIKKTVEEEIHEKHDAKRKEKEERRSVPDMDDFYKKFGTSFR